MLFKDQCVVWKDIDGYTETETEISGKGYRIMVNGSYVTELRLFNNIGAVEVAINCESVIDFGHGVFLSYLQSHTTTTPVHNISNPTKTVKVRIFDVVFNKETGLTTETLAEEFTMNNVIDGKFGNYFPQRMKNQATAEWIMLTNKHIVWGRYHIHKDCNDIITIFVLSAATVTLQPLDGIGDVVTYNYTSGMKVINLNASRWGLNTKRYIISVTTNAGNDWEIEVEKSEFLNHRPIKSGTCYEEDGLQDMNLFFKNPMGGIDNIGNINMTSVSGSARRTNLRLNDVLYRHGGGDNDFEVVSQSEYEFSLGHSYIDSEGYFSGQYEAYITNVSEMWIAGLAACKMGYLVKNDTVIDTIIGVNIDSVSASKTELEGGLVVWQLNISLSQKIPFVA